MQERKSISIYWEGDNMHKLNNKGWGLVEMLLFSAALLIALLIAAYLIYMLYSSF